MSAVRQATGFYPNATIMADLHCEFASQTAPQADIDKPSILSRGRTEGVDDLECADLSWITLRVRFDRFSGRASDHKAAPGAALHGGICEGGRETEVCGRR